MKLMAVKVLLLVLCFATTRSTAGPIRPMTRDEGSATNVRSQINKSFDKNISTTATTKEERDTGLKNPPSFDNVSPTNKLASQIALVDTAIAKGNSSLVGKLNSKNNTIPKNVDDYVDYEVPLDEHMIQVLTTTTEKVVHNIEPPNKTKFDYDSNNLNESFYSEEEKSKKRNKKREETRSATNVQSQINKSFDKNISTTATAKEELGTGLKNSPSFDNVLSKNKTTSDIALVDMVTAKENSSIGKLNSKNNTIPKNVDDYVDYEVSPNEHATQVLPTTTEKVVHNIKSPNKTSFDYDSNNSNETFYSEEEEGKNRNKKLEETRFATNVQSQIDKSFDKNISTSASTKEELGTGLKNSPSFDNVSSKNKTTSDIALVDMVTAKENSSIGKLNSKNNTIPKNVDDYVDYEVSPNEHATQVLPTTTEKVVHNIKSPNKTSFDYDSNNSNETFYSEEEEGKNRNKKLEETRFATNVQSQIDKSFDKNISTSASTKEELGTGLKNSPSFDNVSSKNKTTSDIALVDMVTAKENSSIGKLNSKNNTIPKNVDDYVDYEVPPDEHTIQVLTTTTEKVVHNIKPPNKTKFDYDSNNLNETFYSEEEKSKKRNKKLEDTRSPTNVQPHNAIEIDISTALVKTKEEEVSAYETTTYPIVLVGTTTNQGYISSTKVLDSTKDKIEEDVGYEDNMAHTNVQLNTDKTIEKEITTITVKATEERKLKSAYDDNNRSLADNNYYYSSVYNKTGDNNVFGSENDTSKEREQISYEDYEVLTDGQILTMSTVTTTREEIAYNISSAGKSSSNYELSNSKENLNSEENEGKKRILEKKRQPTNDDSSLYNKTGDSTVLVDSITTQGHIDYVDYTSLTDQMNDNSAYYTHPVNNPLDSKQEQIGFVPLENNAAVGTQNWDGSHFTATDEPVKSSASEEHGEMLQKSSNSDIKTDEKQTDYNDYVIDSEEYEKKLLKPSTSNKTNYENQYDYVDFDLQDESDIPNTEDSDENLNGVPVMKKKDITPLDLLHGLNLDNMMKNNRSPMDKFNVLLQDYLSSKNKKFGTYSEHEANKNPYEMYLENVNSNLIQSLFRY